MKRMLMTLLAVTLLTLTLPAWAATPEAATVAPQTATETETDAPATVEVELDLEALLGTPEAAPVCSCRDLCLSDAQCELFYGPGSQCVPVGPCDCKECQATY